MELAREKDMAGLHVTVTAGPTQEALDPVRYLTNHSTGRMGNAIARRPCCRGADVTLISGPSALKPVPGVKTVDVVSARDMFEAVRLPCRRRTFSREGAAVATTVPPMLRSIKSSRTVIWPFPWNGRTTSGLGG